MLQGDGELHKIKKGGRPGEDGGQVGLLEELHGKAGMAGFGAKKPRRAGVGRIGSGLQLDCVGKSFLRLGMEGKGQRVPWQSSKRGGERRQGRMPWMGERDAVPGARTEVNGRGHQGSMGEQEQREEDGRRGAQSRCPDGREGTSRGARH